VTEEFDLHTAWPVANKKKNLQILSDTISWCIKVETNFNYKIN
jgi:hypothetical protein